jgi:nucleoside-diphosphate-sugar epimerase
MILLTGATGFTGGYVLSLLLAEGYEVTCFVREGSNVDEIKNKGVKLAYGDLNNYDNILSALKDVDTLVNVASLGFGHAQNIVSACVASRVQRAVFFSTTGIFTKLNPTSKKIRLNAEDIIKTSGLDYTILRPTMIYGTSKDRNMCRLVSYILKYPLIPIIGNGEFLQQPVYVKDLARAVLLALKNPISIKREYNVASEKELTYNQVIDITAKLLNKRIMKVHIPLFLCLFLIGIYEKISNKPIIKREQALRLNENKNFSIQIIKNELGYTALNFEEGIKLEIDEISSRK